MCNGWGRGQCSRGGMQDTNDAFPLGLCGQPRASQVHQHSGIQEPVAIVVAHCMEGWMSLALWA